MNIMKGFNVQRCFLMIRNELFLGRGNFLIFAAVVWGVLFLKLVINMNVPKNGTVFGPNYGLFVFVSGLIIFEKSLKDLHNENKGAAWFTLPASLFEKYMTHLSLSITVSVVGIIMLFFLFNIISEGVLRLLLRSFNIVVHFDLLNKDIFFRTARCIILMSPFHLGYIYFKKNAFFKTFLCLLVYLLFLCLIVVAGLRVFLDLNFLHINDPVQTIFTLFNRDIKFEQAWSITKWAAHIGFWYLLAPLCWVTGYFRLKEKEV